LPSGLSSIELQELESVISSSQITDKNKQLFSMGGDFTALYVVHSGMFKTSTVDEHGKERILSFHLPGELMGLDGIHAETYQSTATALTMSSYCKIPFNPLLDIAEDYPIIQKNLLKVMSKEIYSCKKNHVDIGSKAKLALFIKTISHRFKTRGYSEKEFFLPISQRDIASYLGMAEETLSRIFKKLQTQKVVKYKKHILTILDRNLLSEIAES
jgi:CRP/FNR family transcriptional regulator